MQLDQMLYEEINTAIHSMLGERFALDLFWTSVGLLDEGGNIKWKSQINEEYAASPCNPKSEKPRPCLGLDGYAPPPCIFDRIKSPCKIRQNLCELEVITMDDGSLSMGELSRKHFRATKGEEGCPYISLDAFPQFPWIAPRERIIERIKELKPDFLPASAGAEKEAEYKIKAKESMGDGTTGALVPLAQSHGNKLRYIGAIVLCARTESPIWEHLPRVKAVALSLAEVHRHIISLAPDEFDDPKLLLLRALLSQPYKRHLYSSYSSRSVTSGTWHNFQDREEMLSVEPLFVSECEGDWPTHNLPKGLFNYLEDAPDSPPPFWRNMGAKYQYSSTLLASFLKSSFGLDIEVSHIEGEYQFPGWPTSPGLIALLSIINIIEALREGIDDSSESTMGINSIELRIEDRAVTWVFNLKSEIKDLRSRFYEKLRSPGHGSTSGRLISAFYGDLSNHKDSFLDLRSTNELFSQLLEKSDQPIFDIFFGEKQLNVYWEVPTE